MSKYDQKVAMAEDFKQLFGVGDSKQLTVQQLWLVTKFAKYVRLRARNNTAFNNLCSELFPYASFKTITKHHADGMSYPGLEIKIGDSVVTEVDSE